MADFFIEGQKALEILKRDIQMNTVRQGYIFEGSEGIGKKTAARLFSKMALCTGEDKPCGECRHCRMFEAGTHPDFKVIEDDPVKVESIRELNDELFIKPLISDRKVFIIEHADKMNNAAQNAFLKSFEEPPKYAVIILVSSSTQKLLPTILSRGTKIPFSPFPEEDIARFVEKKYNITGARGAFIARYSSGVVGRAIEITEDEEFFKKRDGLIKALLNLSQDKISILPVIEAFGASGRKTPTDIDLYFDIFTGFFRDVSVIKNGGRIINSDYGDLLNDFALKVKGKSARGVVEIAADVKSKINSSMKYDLWITNMLINCWEEIHGTGNRS